MLTRVVSHRSSISGAFTASKSEKEYADGVPTQHKILPKGNPKHKGSMPDLLACSPGTLNRFGLKNGTHRSFSAATRSRP
jgi:hypothetical protein